jgi:DNA-3-methyladenine glycosylase I
VVRRTDCIARSPLRAGGARRDVCGVCCTMDMARTSKVPKKIASAPLRTRGRGAHRHRCHSPVVPPNLATPCAWAPPDDPLYRAYHDEEWGVPERDARALWEKLQLDGFQAGLAWVTVLRKREAFRAELDGFDPERLARWSDARIAKALTNDKIIRSGAKLRAVVKNAQAYLRMAEAGEDFSAFLWGFVDGEPVVSGISSYRDAPTTSALSTEITRALKKRGFSFCGPTIVYAFMQAVGMVNDHERTCPRFREVQKLARRTP